MFSFKRLAFICLNILIGIVFIISAISKLPSLEQFGWTIVETTFFNWTSAEWLARLLIGLELFLGLMFILQLKLKKITIPLSLTILSIFTIYLFLVMHQYGAKESCGCFGELIPMTPMQSIIKNFVLIFLILIQIFSISELKFKYIHLVSGSLFLICLMVPFLFLPPESIYIYEKEKEIQKPIPLSYLYHSTINKAPAIELRKGKHIISFMSLTCRFCRKAAIRLRIMKQLHPEIPFYLILNGEQEKLTNFFDETKAENIPHSMFNGAEQFTMMNDGNSLPTIKWVIDTTVVRESNYLTLDENQILKWLNNN